MLANINRRVRLILASDVFRGLSMFLGSIAAIMIALSIRDLTSIVENQRSERICWFDRTAEVDVLQARISAVTGEIFVVAIITPGEDNPELQKLAEELDILIRKLEPAIDNQVEATSDC